MLNVYPDYTFTEHKRLSAKRLGSATTLISHNKRQASETRHETLSRGPDNYSYGGLGMRAHRHAPRATPRAPTPCSAPRQPPGAGSGLQQLLRRQIQVEERLLCPLGNADGRVPLCGTALA